MNVVNKYRQKFVIATTNTDAHGGMCTDARGSTCTDTQTNGSMNKDARGITCTDAGRRTCTDVSTESTDERNHVPIYFY